MDCTNVSDIWCQQAACHDRISPAAPTPTADLTFPIPAAISFRSWRPGRRSQCTTAMSRAGEDKAVRFGKSDTSNNQYGRSRRLACFNGAMRLRRIPESVGLIDFYPHGAALDHFEQIMGRGE